MREFVCLKSCIDVLEGKVLAVFVSTLYVSKAWAAFYPVGPPPPGFVCRWP